MTRHIPKEEAETGDDRAPVTFDFSSASDTMLIAFGGIKGKLGIAPFEFSNLASRLGTKRIFVRDLEQAWYQRGLPGIADDIPGIADYLDRQIRRQRPERTVFCGNSMGGFAALLFGYLLRVDVVHAFSPQTFVRRFKRFLFLDRRWRREIAKMHRNGKIGAGFQDLKKVFKSGSNNTTEFHIHFSSAHRLDRVHATQLKQFNNVILHSYEIGGHRIIRHLRDSGSLAEILLKSLSSTSHTSS